MFGRVENVRGRSVGVAIRYGYVHEMRLALRQRIPRERERRVCEGIFAAASVSKACLET